MHRPSFLTKISNSRYHRLMLLFWIYWILKGWLWIVVCPPWQAPDEPTHFAYAYRLSGLQPTNQAELEKAILHSLERFKFWRLSKLPDPSPIPESFYSAPLLNIRPTQANQPVLYYQLVAWLFASIQYQELHDQLIIARLLSLVIGALTIITIAFTLHFTLPNHPSAVMYALAFICFQPQVTAIFTSVNNDVLLNLLAAMFFFLLFRWLTLRTSHRLLIGTLGCVAVGLLVKRSALLLLVPLSVGLVKFRKRLQSWRDALVWIISLTGVVISLWLLMSYTAPALLRQLFLRGTEQLSILKQFRVTSLLATDWGLFTTFLGKSFLFNPGWLSHPAPASFYTLWIILYFLPVLGLFWSLSVHRDRLATAIPPFITGVVIFSVAAIAFSIVVVYGASQSLSQGRYFFPVLTPIALILALGFHAFSYSASRILFALTCIALLVLDLGSLFGVGVWEFYLS